MPFVQGVNTGRRPRAWPNTEDPDNVSGLGDTTTATEPAVIAAWRAQVALLRPYYKTLSGQLLQEQATVTRMPSGPNRGQLAYKYPTAQQLTRSKTYTYTLAPADVRAADAAIGKQLDADIEAGRKLQIVEQLPADVGNAVQRVAVGVAKGAGDTARNALGGVLGIPSWAVPVALIGAGALAVKVLAPELWPFGRR